MCSIPIIHFNNNDNNNNSKSNSAISIKHALIIYNEMNYYSLYFT